MELLLTSSELPIASPGVYPNIFTAPALQNTISPTLLAHTIASWDICMTDLSALSAKTSVGACSVFEKLADRERDICGGGCRLTGVGGTTVASRCATLTFFFLGLGECSKTPSSIVPAEGEGETPRRAGLGDLPSDSSTEGCFRIP